MEKKESSYAKDMKNQKIDAKKLKTPSNSKNLKDKSLPWWVELLFIQIGLPDKFLIKILKTKKNLKEIIINDKNLIFTFLFLLTVSTYFYPVIKQSKNKLECETIARSYLIENKNLTNITRKQLRMLSTNFCNGGEEIYEIENIKK